MTAFLNEWIMSIATFALSAAVCTLPELLAPVEKQTWKSRLRACLFWAIFLAATVAVVLPVQALIHRAGLKPLISLDLRTAVEVQHPLALAASYLLIPFLPYLAFDCLYYWFHRLQ